VSPRLFFVVALCFVGEPLKNVTPGGVRMDFELDLDLAVTGREQVEDDEEVFLSLFEIERLRFFAEHLDLADPVIWFLGRE